MITSLKDHKLAQEYSQLEERVADLKAQALPEFNALVFSNRIIGNWDDKTWTYRNRTIYFSRPFDCKGCIVTGKTPAQDKVALEGLWADIYRLFILSKIKGHNGDPKTISSLMTYIVWLGEYCRYDIVALRSLNQDKLDAIIPLLHEKFTGRGPFERYKTIISFVKNFIVVNKLCRRFLPKVKMADPSLKRVDSTSELAAKARNEKYDDRIDIYIGTVKQRFEEDRRRLAQGQSAKCPEPKPCYDELRLLAMPFFLALGLRIGEVCRLPVGCIGYDEHQQRWFLRVLTEKGELASARPIPRKWEDVIVSSYNRILEITKSFRAFAKQVETEREQAFIKALSFPERHAELSKSLSELGFNPEQFFLRDEIGNAGDIHHSGLAYNNLRITRTKDGVEKKGSFADACVGVVTVKKSPSERVPQQRIVVSKAKVASLAVQQWTNYREDVYKQNQDDGEINESVSSTSYAIIMPFSDFLFVAKDELFNAGSLSEGLIPKPLTPRDITRWLTEDSSRSKSVFRRYDIRDDSNDLVEINSHQFRHWLSTALLRSGKNEAMVDLFMGRKAGQTRHYDHRTPKERAEDMRQRYLAGNPPDDVLGRRIKRMRENNVSVIEIENALNHTLSVVHYTPWGTCNRDLDVSPCEKGMMCLRGENGQGCQHFGIDPEDEVAKHSIINTKAHYEAQLYALLPNYEQLLHTLNKQEPLDQHVQYCIDTIEGCENALKAYERVKLAQGQVIPVVQVFTHKEVL